MRKLSITAALAGLFIMSACDKDSDSPSNPNELPETYNFDNVDISGQQTRLDMLSEIMAYVELSDDGQAVNESQVMAMFTNDAYTWSNSSLNGSSKQIANKLDSDGGATIAQWVYELDSISQNAGTGSNGVAGLVQSNSGSKQYLLNSKGYHLAELIEKGAMGALAYYQATAVYLSESKMEVDNEVVEAGKGTSMQHHWDEAFGYWGVPTDFGSDDFTYDSESAYHRFWAKYTNAVNAALGSNSKLMDAFIKGRDAINNKDYDSRDAAIAEVRHQWEQVVAAMAIHYLNGARANFADNAIRNHELSEGMAFIWSLQFNPSQELSDQEIEDLLNQYFGNLYEISIDDINQVRDLLADRYNLGEVKETL